MVSALQRTLLYLLAGLTLAAQTGAATDATPTAPTNPVLYLFAHQDDEVFVLGRMRRDVREGREVHALWTSDGALDGKPAARERESRAVMALIGVPAANLHFLQFPDHTTYRHLPALAARVAEVARSRPFGEIVSPAYEGGNIDHDTAALLGAFATRMTASGAIHREFPLYNRFRRHERYGVFLPNTDAPITFEPLDPDGQVIVRNALKLYRSQRVLLTVLSIVGHKNTMLVRGEPFRLAPRYDYRTPPTAEVCGYEVAGLHRAKFADWLAAVEPFLRAQPALDAAFPHQAVVSEAAAAAPRRVCPSPTRRSGS